MKIQRAIFFDIVEKIRTTKKIVVIYGARQVGKTTIARDVVAELGMKTLFVNADQEKYVDVLSSRDLSKMKSLVSGYSLLVIDEAQRIPEIGLNLKILADEMPELRILATGSSSFDLANKISEPLTGRVASFTLFPLSVSELSKERNDFELGEILESMLIFGEYPEVFTAENRRQKEDILMELSRSYLYKDALDLLIVKQPKKIKDLLKLLAFQIGSEVSILELSNALDLSRETVERYIDLLEKSFVIFRLPGFSRNLRKEVTKMDKIYFYDIGIRNAVIENVKSLTDRNDVGQLWENFLIVERMKFLAYSKTAASSYFWRTYTGSELDYVEEGSGILSGYEFKWGNPKTRYPQSWVDTYPDARYECVNQESWLQFVR